MTRTNMRLKDDGYPRDRAAVQNAVVDVLEQHGVVVGDAAVWALTDQIDDWLQRAFTSGYEMFEQAYPERMRSGESA